MFQPDSGFEFINSPGIYAEENVLVLSNPNTFQNTTLVTGAEYIPAVTSVEYGANHYFSGYVFRGDSRFPTQIFEEGFTLQYPLVSMDQARIMAGAARGITGSEGVSTSVCVQAASHYRRPPGFRNMEIGCVYLIDAVNFRGYAIPTPRPNNIVVPIFPILRQIYEVNFIHSIPNTSIIGVVWPDDAPEPKFYGAVEWFTLPRQLKLAVNPEYEGGMEGALGVVERFNA